MKRIRQIPIALLIVITLFAVAVEAQHHDTKPPATTQIEGLITTTLNTGNCGMPTFALNTNEGKEYAIHLGTLKNTEGETFAPQIGDAITMTGFPCSGMTDPSQGQGMIHAAEIAIGEETFRAPVGSMTGMMHGMMMGPDSMGQGQMGQGMTGQRMMGQRPMGQAPMGPGQPGQELMMCPGMAGQPMQGRSIPGQGQAALGAMGPGAMSCCNSTGVPVGAVGCGMPQPAAAPEEGAETD